MNRHYRLAAHCPNCHKPMRLMRTVQRLARLPELQTFACEACDATVIEVFQPEIFEAAVRWFDPGSERPSAKADFHGIRLLAGSMGRSPFWQ